MNRAEQGDQPAGCVKPGFNPNRTGRGPRQMHRWYEVVCTDGEVIVARWVGYDATAARRADHVLFFDDDEYEHDIPYGQILSCLPMNARYRAQEIASRAERDQRRRRQTRERSRRRRTTTTEER